MTTLARRLRTREKRRRRGRLVKKITVVVALVALGAFGVLSFLFSDRFALASVSIQGLERVHEDDVRAYIDEWTAQKRFFVFSERTYWMLRGSALAEGVKSSFSQIREVAIEKDFPSRLNITVDEYDGWGVLCRGKPGECFWIDHDGIAFELSYGFSGLIVPKIKDERSHMVKLGEPALSPEIMRIASFFHERAVTDVDLQSVEFILEAKDSTVRIKTRADWDILLSEKTDPERAYKNLRTAIDSDIKGRTKELLYIDLRYGNRIFYKFK